MKQRNTLITLSFALATLLLSRPVVLAQYTSTASNNTCVVDDVQVRSMSLDKFSDNLSINQYIFKKGDLVEYQVSIENPNNTNQTNVKVDFSLPQCFSLVFGPNQDKMTNNKLSWTIDELKAGEKKVYTVRAKVGENCVSSKKVTASLAVCSNGGSDSDTSAVYVGAVPVPDTGAADIVVKTMLSVGLIVAGYSARRLARGY